MSVIRAADSRRTETPNGVMTTLASPTQGGAGQVLWRVEMGPGASGPRHAFDTEQVWTVLNGSATVDLDGDRLVLHTGDTAVFPADVPRQVFADPETGLTAVATAPAGSLVFTPDGVHVEPGCAAPASGDKLAPAWVV